MLRTIPLLAFCARMLLCTHASNGAIPLTTFSDFLSIFTNVWNQNWNPDLKSQLKQPRSSPRLHRFLRFHFKCFLCISSICKDLPLLISPRLKTPMSSERVGSDFEWVPSSPRSLFNCNLREPLPSASSAAASACPFYFVNNNRIGNISSSFVPKTQFLP